MTIYLDLILLENFILNLIILYAVGIETKTKIKHLKIILASILGSLYAIVTYIIKNTFVNSIIMKIILSIIMIYISFDTLLPLSHEYGDWHYAITGIMSGIIVIWASLLLLNGY